MALSEEDRIMVKRYANPKPANRLDRIAEDYGLTTREAKAKIKVIMRVLIDYYESKEGLMLKEV